MAFVDETEVTIEFSWPDDLSRFLVLASRPWSRQAFARLKELPGTWEMLDSHLDLTTETITDFDPDVIFVLHWSHKIPSEVVDQFRCIGFHMTDLPYGRGGSPLQNLIVRGHSETRLSAFLITEEFDAGPIFMKLPLNLEGPASDIYERMSALQVEMVEAILENHPTPSPQSGEIVIFKRRQPNESNLRYASPDTSAIYDFIRMLDAEGYPRAFLEVDGARYEFFDARLDADGQLSARVMVEVDDG